MAGFGVSTEGGSSTHPVATKTRNAFGLYDMLGNVWEWNQDWYHDSYNGAPTDGSARQSPAGSARVLRGGGWSDVARYARASFRGSVGPGARLSGIGLRCVRDRM